MANPLKWTGGKTPMASLIVRLFPAHERYVEPFAGGAAVALQHARHDPDASRTIADLNAGLVTFWQVLQRPEGLAHLLASLPRRLPTRDEFDAAGALLAGQAGQGDFAAAFFVRNRASRAADMKTFYTPTRRLRRGMDEQLSAWLSALDGLPEAHRLLQRAEVLHADGLGLVEEFKDDPAVLLYLDPPYLHGTRAGADYYAHEMDDAGHKKLLDLVGNCSCKVVLSGYRSDLYDAALAGWHRADIARKNSMAGGKAKRVMTECLWCNFDPA